MSKSNWRSTWWFLLGPLETGPTYPPTHLGVSGSVQCCTFFHPSIKLAWKHTLKCTHLIKSSNNTLASSCSFNQCSKPVWCSIEYPLSPNPFGLYHDKKVALAQLGSKIINICCCISQGNVYFWFSFFTVIQKNAISRSRTAYLAPEAMLTSSSKDLQLIQPLWFMLPFGCCCNTPLPPLGFDKFL